MCSICDPKKKYNECICCQNFKYLDKKTKEIADNKYSNFCVLKDLTVSTITLCANFCSKIDVDKFKKNYTHNISKDFYNSVNVYITTKYQDKLRISVKIFKNGKIGMTGLTNSKSCSYSLRKIFKRLDKLDCFEEDTKSIKDVKICMINSDFKLDKNIRQQSLCNILENNKSEYNISRFTFNPSKYPAINIKFNLNNKDITCAVFRPGSIIITGGDNFENYKKIFLNVLSLLDNNSLIYSKC